MLTTLHKTCDKLNVLLHQDSEFCQRVFSTSWTCSGVGFYESWAADAQVFSNVLGLLNGLFSVLENRPDGTVVVHRLLPVLDHDMRVVQFMVMEKKLNEQEIQLWR